MTEKKRIVFVDDESAVLRAYERAFFEQDDIWNMSFVDNGPAAIDIMTKEKVDMIVTDIRMPGMDGIELLSWVVKEKPEILRVIISGQFDEKVVQNSLRLVQQYLFKPCDPDKVISTINETFDLGDKLSSDVLRDIVDNLEALPSLPTLYTEITNALRDPKCSLRDVGQIIVRDIAMTTKILQLVNSAYFGLRRKVTTPDEAVVYLGTETVKAMVLSLQVFSEASVEGLPKGHLDELWEHCFVVANFAKKIASIESDEKSVIDNSFTSGIIHDVGQLILLLNRKEQYLTFLQEQKTSDKSVLRLEEKIFGTNHCELGAYLLNLWGLPHATVQPIAYHHTVERFADLPFNPSVAVAAANIIARELTNSPKGNMYENTMRSLEKAGYSKRYNRWKGECEKLLKVETK